VTRKFMPPIMSCSKSFLWLQGWSFANWIISFAWVKKSPKWCQGFWNWKEVEVWKEMWHFWINEITIAIGWMIAFGLRELVLHEDLNENHVKLTIYGTTKSQIMSIWIYNHWFKQFLMDVIFGHFLCRMINITCRRTMTKKKLV